MTLIGETWHIHGTGYKVLNFPAVEIENKNCPGNTYLRPTTDAQNKINEKIEYIQKRRGEIITKCVELEYVIGEIISHFFLKDNPKKREIFHEIILDTTFLSFSQKKNILRLLMKTYPDEFLINDEAGRKKVFHILEEIIKKRNALAHGEIIIDLSNDKSIIRYYDSNANKKNNFEINSVFFDTLFADVGGAALMVWILKENRNTPEELICQEK